MHSTATTSILPFQLPNSLSSEHPTNSGEIERYVIDRNTQQTPEGLSHYYIYTGRDEVKTKEGSVTLRKVCPLGLEAAVKR